MEIFKSYVELPEGKGCYRYGRTTDFRNLAEVLSFPNQKGNHQHYLPFGRMISTKLSTGG